MSDEAGVIDTLYRYCHAIDNRDADAWLDCFTGEGVFRVKRAVDAEWSLDLAGREALADWFQEYDRRSSRANHLIQNPRAFVDGDRARAASYYLILRADEGPVAVQRTGRYDDELVRGGDGVWRLSRRHAWVDLGSY